MPDVKSCGARWTFPGRAATRSRSRRAPASSPSWCGCGARRAPRSWPSASACTPTASAATSSGCARPGSSPASRPRAAARPPARPLAGRSRRQPRRRAAGGLRGPGGLAGARGPGQAGPAAGAGADRAGDRPRARARPRSMTRSTPSRATLAALGFQPELEVAGDRLRCRLGNCPYRDSVRVNADAVCGLHRGITDGPARADRTGGAADRLRAPRPRPRRLPDRSDRRRGRLRRDEHLLAGGPLPAPAGDGLLRRRPAGLRPRRRADPPRRRRPHPDAGDRPPLRLRLAGGARRPHRHRLDDGLPLPPVRRLDPAVEARPGRPRRRPHPAAPALGQSPLPPGRDPARHPGRSSGSASNCHGLDALPRALRTPAS